MSSIYYYYEGQFDGMIDSNIETVNFLRLKQLTVGYNLPTDWAKSVTCKEYGYFLREKIYSCGRIIQDLILRMWM